MKHPPYTFESPSEEQEILTRSLEYHSQSKVPIIPISSVQFPTKKISTKFINDTVGEGLFTEEKIESGQYIDKYTGLLRRNNRRYGYPMNNYCYQYPVPDKNDINFVIDGTSGNLTRYINHSNHPNIKPHYAFYEGYYHVLFFALETISPGTQLTFNYGKTYWYTRGLPQEL